MESTPETMRQIDRKKMLTTSRSDLVDECFPSAAITRSALKGLPPKLTERYQEENIQQFVHLQNMIEPGLMFEVEARTEYGNIDLACDTVGLLNLMYEVLDDDPASRDKLVVELDRELVNTTQQKDESTRAFVLRFLRAWKRLKQADLERASPEKPGFASMLKMDMRRLAYNLDRVKNVAFLCKFKAGEYSFASLHAMASEIMKLTDDGHFEESQQTATCGETVPQQKCYGAENKSLYVRKDSTSRAAKKAREER